LKRKIDGISARLRAVFHKISHPMHKMRWRKDDCDIICETCERIYWCRLLEQEVDLKEVRRGVEDMIKIQSGAMRR